MARKYKYKHFYEKVNSNKSPKWFRDQKRILGQKIKRLEESISQLEQIKSLITRGEKSQDKKNVEDYIRHKYTRPEGFIANIFKTKSLINWEQEHQNLKNKVYEFAFSIVRKEPIVSFLKEKEDHNLLKIYLWDHQTHADRTIVECIDDQKKWSEGSLESTHRDMETLLPKYNKIMQHEARRQSEKATVARVKNKSRELAEEIKKKLVKAKDCPYCEQGIGETPHADHIYPLAHGGRETESNMIYVCASCNLKKSDNTLLAFCEETGLDFIKIARRLKDEGKKI